MSTTNKCLGCGISIQHDHPTHSGYQQKVGQVYCQACFQLLHYGKVSEHLHPKDLPNLNPNALMVMVSSVLHLDLLFSYPIHRYQPDASYIYIINQLDLLPQSTNLQHLLEKITAKAKNEKIPYIDIVLMSAKNPYDIDHLKTYLTSFKHKDIYLLGVQNSGKTTIFKALTHHKEALAFKKAGLTQEPLFAPFGDQMLYDMPGLYQKGYVHNFLSYDVYKDLIPDQNIHAKIYPIKNGQTLFIEGLIAVTYEGEPNSLVFYLSRFVKFHKTNAKKIPQLLEDKENQFKIFAQTYEEKKFKVKDGKFQLTFADLGMMHVTGPCHMTVTFPKGMHLSLTEAMFS
jgi:30S ribosome assembly GTPase